MMMARAEPKLALRPMLPADVPLIADIFRASVEELTADDYSAAQQEAWAAAADDPAFGARLADAVTLLGAAIIIGAGLYLWRSEKRADGRVKI